MVRGQPVALKTVYSRVLVYRLACFLEGVIMFPERRDDDCGDGWASRSCIEVPKPAAVSSSYEVILMTTEYNKNTRERQREGKGDHTGAEGYAVGAIVVYTTLRSGFEGI